MSTPSKRAVFLEKAGYRQRRLRDVLRVLPVIGMILFLVPLLWQDASGAGSVAAIQFVFAVWIGLIVLSALMSRFLAPTESGAEPEPERD